MTRTYQFSALLIALYSTLLPLTGHAQGTCSRTGAITVCGKGELENLHVAGKAILTETTVLNRTEIAGLLEANKVYLNSVKVSGKATLINSNIQGNTKISGLLIANHSTFNQKLTISSDLTYLNGTKTRDIEIDKGGEQQILCIQHHSIVDGNITFTTHQGIVVLDADSQIKGVIKGGYVEKRHIENLCSGEYEHD